MQHSPDQLAEQLGVILIAKNWTLAVAESCTGGWLAKIITDVPGCSAWFDRGFVTYSNAAKQQQLDVSSRILKLQGAVSEHTVSAMVTGTLKHSTAQIAVATSGIAGPTGGTPDKPVGTVYIAYGQRNTIPITQQHHFTGDRTAVRYQTVVAALEFVLNEVKSDN